MHLDNTENLQVSKKNKINISGNTVYEDMDWNVDADTMLPPSPVDSTPYSHNRELLTPDAFKLVVEPQPKIMEHTKVIRLNLQQQQIEIEKQIALLEGQLNKQKEYLAKIEGGIDVLDELAKA